MRTVLALLISFTLVGCQTTREKAAQYLTVGATYTDMIGLGKDAVQIPLPEGQWKLVGLDTWYNNLQTGFTRGILVDVKGKILRRAVQFDIPIDFSSNGYVVSKWCERDNIHHMKKRANYEGGEQDCWGVNHYRLSFSANKLPEYMKQARDYIVANKIRVPGNTIYVRYQKADVNALLQASYHFNPEVDGFPPPKETIWATSDWHRNQMYLDEKKVAYIDKIKRWGTAFDSKVTAGFERKLNTTVVAPMAQNPTERSPAPTVSRGVEGKLSKLKDLHNKGLITDEEYSSQKKEVLEGL